MNENFHGMKASYEYCDICRRKTTHYTAPGGWPICQNGHGTESLDDIGESPTEDKKEEPKQYKRLWERD